MPLVRIHFIIRVCLWLCLGTFTSAIAGAGCSSESLVHTERSG
jgi:hypothetical protein